MGLEPTRAPPVWPSSSRCGESHESQILQGKGAIWEAADFACGQFDRQKQAEKGTGYYLDADYSTKTPEIPIWNAFMTAFYAANTITMTQDSAICTAVTAPTKSPRTTDEGGNTLSVEDQAAVLFYNPTMTVNEPAGSVTMTSEIAETATDAIMYYGIDATVVENLDTDAQYAYVYFGSSLGELSGNSYSATWNGIFYSMTTATSTTNPQPVFFEDNGGGYVTVPVIYFPKGVTASKDADTGLIEKTGGVTGWLDFGFNFATNKATTKITLYAENEDGSSTEIESSEEGTILFIIDAFVGDEIQNSYREYIGGFDSDNPVRFAWKDSGNLIIEAISAEAFAASKDGIDDIVVEIVGYSEKADKSESMDLWDEIFPAEGIGKSIAEKKKDDASSSGQVTL